MRITSPGIVRDAGFTFEFGGELVKAFPGETIAAALLSAGITKLRKTRAGDWRGLFCGMGVCGECSVRVDGVARRACLEAARPGIVVTPALALAPTGPELLAPVCGKAAMLEPDLLVIGAGPAGLSAARIAALAGLSVVVVDERSKAGGQYFKQPGSGFIVDRARLHPQFSEGAALAEAALTAGATMMHGATVWATFGDGEVLIVDAGGARSIRPRRLILAAGAFERPHAISGWTLPGVMTTGAAQTLLRAYQTAPGRRVLVAGNGPLNLQVARELIRAGVEVVALAEQAAAPSLRHGGDALTMARTAPRLVLEGIDHLATLRRAGVPVHYRHVAVRAEGKAGITRAVIAEVGSDGRILAGSEKTFDVDALCLGYGFLPQSEMARAIGCVHIASGPHGLVAERDEDGRSSVPHVFIVGDAGGLGGARIAIAQGLLAGAAAANDLGAPPSMKIRRETRHARKALARNRRFQQSLWRMYAPVSLAEPLAEPDTLICRCENVDLRTVDALLNRGLHDLGAIKRSSRVGMGRCQGRYCGALIADMITLTSNTPLAHDAFFAPRTPFKPVHVGAVAALHDNQGDVR